MADKTRDWTVATFVVHQGKVLLLWHRKLSMWLPPGGHIGQDELPDEAAVREVREETGIEVVLMSSPGFRGIPGPLQLSRPEGIQLEDIAPGHQHIDLIYFAKPRDPRQTQPVANDEVECVGWYDAAGFQAIGLTAEVSGWAQRALLRAGE